MSAITKRAADLASSGKIDSGNAIMLVDLARRGKSPTAFGINLEEHRDLEEVCKKYESLLDDKAKDIFSAALNEPIVVANKTKLTGVKSVSAKIISGGFPELAFDARLSGTSHRLAYTVKEESGGTLTFTVGQIRVAKSDAKQKPIDVSGSIPLNIGDRREVHVLDTAKSTVTQGLALRAPILPQ